MNALRFGKTCFCHTCQKDFHCLGIARHRVAHHERGEDCEITYTNGDTYESKAPQWRIDLGNKERAKRNAKQSKNQNNK